MEKKFIRVDEVAKELEISESHAYKIMRMSLHVISFPLHTEI